MSDGKGGTGTATSTDRHHRQPRSAGDGGTHPGRQHDDRTAIAFTATGTDPDGDTLTYAWDFGDTTSSTTQNPSKTYTAAGTYTAKVTVSDGKGGSGSAR